MKPLLFKKVFNAYHLGCKNKLGHLVYHIYIIYLRIKERITSLSKVESFHLNQDKDYSDSSLPLPKNNDGQDAHVELYYLDFFDYCPKENINEFINQIKRVIANSPRTIYSSQTDERIDSIKNLQNATDNYYMMNLKPIEVDKEEWFDSFSLSIFNLSSSMISIKYSFNISDAFNDRLSEIINKNFSPDTSPLIHIQDKWFKPSSFGIRFLDGDYLKNKELYDLDSKLKWSCYKYLNKRFSLFFIHDGLFLPSFSVYYTDIDLADQSKESVDWIHCYFGFERDYSQDYDAMICVKERNQNAFSALIGGYTEEYNSDRSIVLNAIDENYVVPVVAETISALIHDLGIKYSKKIAKRIQYKLAGSLLKLRIKIEKTVYYPYRFISEFTGNNVMLDFINKLTCVPFPKIEAYSIRRYSNVSNRIEQSKKEFDLVLKNLDDAVVYANYKNNNRIQFLMLFITVLSLLVTSLSINDGVLWEYIKGLFVQYLNS